jgi:hypothetical protein
MMLIYRLRGEQREANDALRKLVTEKRLGEVKERLNALVTATEAEAA